MIHIHEIDNDGRGPNLYDISIDNKWITSVPKETLGVLITHYDLKGVDYTIHTVDEYYAKEG
jgi:hypothetical protein